MNPVESLHYPIASVEIFGLVWVFGCVIASCLSGKDGLGAAFSQREEGGRTQLLVGDTTAYRACEPRDEVKELPEAEARTRRARVIPVVIALFFASAFLGHVRADLYGPITYADITALVSRLFERPFVYHSDYGIPTLEVSPAAPPQLVVLEVIVADEPPVCR